MDLTKTSATKAAWVEKAMAILKVMQSIAHVQKCGAGSEDALLKVEIEDACDDVGEDCKGCPLQWVGGYSCYFWPFVREGQQVFAGLKMCREGVFDD
jgi:hypothetical protein